MRNLMILKERRARGGSEFLCMRFLKCQGNEFCIFLDTD